jgi:hypothetical protein
MSLRWILRMEVTLGVGGGFEEALEAVGDRGMMGGCGCREEVFVSRFIRQYRDRM